MPFAVRPLLQLSSDERARLATLAPLFGMQIAIDSDTERSTLLLRNGETLTFADAERASLRLLAEICSCCAPFVAFRVGESCASRLLSYSDAQIRRFAALGDRKSLPIVPSKATGVSGTVARDRRALRMRQMSRRPGSSRR